MNSDTIQTCREALERWYEDLEAHDAIYHVDNPAEIMAEVRRALQDLAQPSEWTPLQNKIAFGFGHESIVIDATSIGGLPLPDDVMIMQRTPAQPTTSAPEHIGTVNWTGPSGRTWKVDLEIDESEE